jgi:sugar phosphate isomerase/epimerase
MRRETKRRCDDLGVGVDVFESFYLKADTEVAGLRPAFESGVWLGARRVALVTQDEEQSRLDAHVYEYCDLAAEHGLTVLLEYTPRMTQKSLADALALAQRIDHPALRIECDALHTFRSGGSAAELAAAPRRLIGRAQLSDGPAAEPAEGGFHEASKERMVPGEGELPLVEFVQALPSGVVIGLEVPMARLAAAGVDAAGRVRCIANGARRVLDRAGRGPC